MVHVYGPWCITHALWALRSHASADVDTGKSLLAHGRGCNAPQLHCNMPLVLCSHQQLAGQQHIRSAAQLGSVRLLAKLRMRSTQQLVCDVAQLTVAGLGYVQGTLVHAAGKLHVLYTAALLNLGFFL